MPRTWVVTGGSRGIGRAIAERAVAEGDQVVIVARSSAANEVAEELSGVGPGKASAIRADLSDPATPDELAPAAAALLGGRIDVLVNNAALHRGGRIRDLEPTDYEAVVQTDLVVPFRLCRAALAFMDAGCRIINIGAVVGERGFPGDTPYASAKAGLAGLTKSLAVELAREGITANVVVPGFTTTDMTGGLDERAREKIISTIPLRRPADASEIADVVNWVSRSDYMTGSVVHVDGGLGAKL